MALALRTLFSRCTSAGSRFVDALPDLRSDPARLNADVADGRLAYRADPIRLKPPEDVDDVGLKGGHKIVISLTDKVCYG